MWVESVEINKDSKVVAHTNGIASKIRTFSSLFSVKLGELILRQRDSLNQTLQQKEFLTSEGPEVAKLVVNQLETARNEDSFNLFREI